MSWFRAALRHTFQRVFAYRWAYALPIVTLLLPATLYAVRLPDTYQARALVRVREMSSGEYGSRLPTEEGARAFATVATVRDRLITAQTLDAIAPLLFPNTSLTGAAKAQALNDAVEFDRLSDYSFSIAVSAQDPDRASAATNKLLETFLREERAPLLRRAQDRSRFYAREHAEAVEAHKVASDAVKAFRVKHAEVLPELKDVLGGELTALRAESRVQAQLAAASRRRVDFLSEQIARGGTTTPKVASAATATAEEKRLDQQLSQQQALLSGARKRLAEARTRHTEKMPDVISLRSEVSGLQTDVQASVAALRLARGRARTHASRLEKERSAEALGLLRRLRGESIAEAIKARESDEALRKRVRAIELRLARLPATAAALSPLLEALERVGKTRDAMQASASTAAEREEYLEGSGAEDVTSYQVAQWATPPVKPSGPKRFAFMLSAIAIGALLGYGLMLLRRHFEVVTVSAPAQLHNLLPEATIVSVPWLESGRRRFRFPWRELIPGTWVVACLALTIWTLAAHKGLVEAPGWLEGLMGRST